MRPIGERVILKREESSMISEGGLHLLNPVEDKSDIGEVIAVGNGKKLGDGTVVPMEIKVGDKVIFNKFAIVEIVVDEEKFLLINESDIVAVFE